MKEFEAEANLAAMLDDCGMTLVDRQYRIGSKQVDIVAAYRHELIAVEVKLREWRRACGQAYLNSGYFDRTYIALPVNPRRRIDRGYLLTHGVGLIEFDDSNASVVIEAPLTRTPDGGRRAVHSRLQP